MRFAVLALITTLLAVNAQPSSDAQRKVMKAVQSKFTHMFRRPLKLRGIFAKLRAKHMAKFKTRCKAQTNLATTSNFLFGGESLRRTTGRSARAVDRG